MSANQLCSAIGYDVKNLVFGKFAEEKNPVGGAVNHTIQILHRYPNGTVGPLVLKTVEGLFSFGLSTDKNEDGGVKQNGKQKYSFPIVLFSREGPTQEQQQWVDGLKEIIKKCKEELLTNKEKYNLDIEEGDLRKFGDSIIYVQKDKITKKPIVGKSPIIYPKLYEDKKTGDIKTSFRDVRDLDEHNNPRAVKDVKEALMGRYCIVNCALKIECIYLGSNSKYSIRLKLADVIFRTVGGENRQLLPPPAPTSVLLTSGANPLEEASRGASAINQADSDEEDSEEEIAQLPPPAVVAEKKEFPKRNVKATKK